MARPWPDLLIRIAPQTRPALIALACVGILSGLAALLVAVAMAWLVTAVATGEATAGALTLLIISLVIRGLLAAGSEYVAHRTGQACAAAVRAHVLGRWLRLPVESRPPAQECTTLAGEGIAAIEPYVARYLPSLVIAAVVPAAALVVLAVVDIWSALIVLLTLPLLPVFAALIGMHTRDQTRTRMTALTALSGHFLDVVQGLPTLVAYGRAEHQTRVVRAIGDRHRRATVRTLRTAFMSSAALELLATISVAMVAVSVGLRLAYGTIDLQVGLTAILLAPEAYWPIRRVGTEFHNAAGGTETLRDLSRDLNQIDESPGAAHARPPGGPQEPQPDEASASGRCAVLVHRVGYSYAGHAPAIDDYSAHAPGEPHLTVLTGPSGSGKSTLLDLLAGVRTPSTGEVVCPPAHLASQRPLLISGTVLDNLALGTERLDADTARSTLQAVGLWEGLASRGGLDAAIGDDGFGLSAGQRARLALARAILSDAPVVLLDEPTAHIAAESVAHIRALINELATTRTVIVATHDAELVAVAQHHWRMSRVISRAARQPDASFPGAPQRQNGAGQVAGGVDTTERLGELALWAAIGPRGRLRLAQLMGGLSVASGVALTATSGWLIVQASFQPVVLTLLVAIVGVRTFGLARPLLRYAERVVSHDVALADLAVRRGDLFSRLIPLTPARLGRRSRTDFLTAVVRDLDDVVDEKVRVQVPWAATVLASSVAFLVLVFALPAAGLVMAAGTVAALGVGVATARQEQLRQDEAVHARGQMLAAAQTLAQRLSAVQSVSGALHSLYPVQAADPLTDHSQQAAPRVLAELADREAVYARAERRLISVRCLGMVASWLVVAAVTAVVASLAARGFLTGALSAPWAALVALTPMALAEAWTALPEVGGARARARAASARLETVLTQPAAVNSASSTTLSEAATPVELEDVSASWTPGGPVDVRALTLPPLHTAEQLQLTGPNGGGKSTALAVLARHLDPVAGSYRIAGHDTALLSVSSVKARIAVVDDEPHAFAGSVRANLALAAPGADDQSLRMALHAVDLDRWLASLPSGLDSPVSGLSGGERARLAMARAVLSRRPIVVMDEPAAHLDDATAERALAGVRDSTPLDWTADHREQECAGPTMVVVSHRPQTWSGFQTVDITDVTQPALSAKDPEDGQATGPTPSAWARH